MFAIILTVLAVGAFFILFFKSPMRLKNKVTEKEEEEAVATPAAVGFIEDTGLETYGAVFKKGNMGTFVAHDTVPRGSWMSGSPYLEEIVEA
tara:strand:- start:90 stop:365 length:276 start_codon:yes stop_codon:yes gene_type:complete